LSRSSLKLYISAVDLGSSHQLDSPEKVDYNTDSNNNNINRNYYFSV